MLELTAEFLRQNHRKRGIRSPLLTGGMRCVLRVKDTDKWAKDIPITDR
jgi:hypothetical protein